MCQAFSGLLDRERGVLWKMGVDSHSELVDEFKLRDNTDRKDGMTFARFEITPVNKDYLYPDKWTFTLDERIKPTWWNEGCEMLCWEAHKEWERELDKVLVRKPMVHPLTGRTPPERITKKHLSILKQWDSVWDSVWASVGNSVWDSVGDSVGDSVWDSVWASVGNSVGNSVWDSVRDSVGASVWDSVWAYTSSFFTLPRSEWKYTGNIECDTDNPFQPCIDLWELGLVPSFDGKTWRLHGGKDARILWEGTV